MFASLPISGTPDRGRGRARAILKSREIHGIGATNKKKGSNLNFRPPVHKKEQDVPCDGEAFAVRAVGCSEWVRKHKNTKKISMFSVIL